MSDRSSKAQIPGKSSKLQIPNPKQIPMSKSQKQLDRITFCFWSLEFEICLKFGAWVLGFQLRIQWIRLAERGGTRCPQRVDPRGGTVAAATPQRVGPAAAGRIHRNRNNLGGCRRKLE